MPKLNRAGRKRPRNENTRTTGPGNYLIVTEGIETEVNYFNNIKKIIENLFRNNIIVNKVSLEIEGKGRSTMVLVNEALKIRSLRSYSEVWVVFDKDANEDFNEAIAFAKSRGLNVAWSNECFELWLLLHFQNLNSAIHRDDYSSKLSHHFKEKNINNGIYDKNIKEIFDITYPFLDDAIKRSKCLVDEYKKDKVFSPTKMNPCTTVQDLVEQLIKYTKAN
ncbi:RloB family protein [Clostridium thailandense]|uniref:RloB family protein n=1 Tax=Clostridium thailandense TaxID=2794346 RepID=UPI003988EB12